MTWSVRGRTSSAEQTSTIAFLVSSGAMLHTTIDDAIDAAGLPLLGVVPEDPDVPYCLNQGLVLRERNYYAARAYENIAKRIMGQKAPLMKI